MQILSFIRAHPCNRSGDSFHGLNTKSFIFNFGMLSKIFSMLEKKKLITRQHPIIITKVSPDEPNKQIITKEFYPIHPVHVTSAKPSIENQFSGQTRRYIRCWFELSGIVGILSAQSI
jgi:hypothetical protein